MAAITSATAGSTATSATEENITLQAANIHMNSCNSGYVITIANPQILGSIPLSQICKFLRFVSVQIAVPHIFFISPQTQICKFIKNTAQLCENPSKKSSSKKIIL
jgi:hypothetical protein